ncbi:MAG: methylated-DNA-protein-cysteine methyltransferase-like protein [Myxococcota bacterium]|jgi:methylated-DNA-protein-cysteine methyltransferase-like protein
MRVVRPGFNAAVYAVVRRVPAGTVTTYGDVGAALGSPRVARHVGFALAALRDDDVPWHRVINATGRISFKGETPRAELQRFRLEAEGVRFAPSGRVEDFATLRIQARDALLDAE